MQKEVVHNSKFWKPNIKEDVVLYKGHFNTFESQKHVHDEYTISLVHDGNMRTFIDGFTHDFCKSTILTINPDQVHSCMPDNKTTYKYNTIYIKPSFFQDIFNENSICKDIYFKNLTIDNQNLYQRLSYLVSLDEQNRISNFNMECEFIDTIKEIIKINSTCKEKIDNKVHLSLIKKAKEYINDNLHLELTLDDIVQELDISKFHFLKVFKEHMHISPHNYLMLKRVERARKALEKGKSIISTANYCGFNDQSHLNRRFKAVTGITPGSYKNFFN